MSAIDEEHRDAINKEHSCAGELRSRALLTTTTVAAIQKGGRGGGLRTVPGHPDHYYEACLVFGDCDVAIRARR